jgi:hypothetical protein
MSATNGLAQTACIDGDAGWAMATMFGSTKDTGRQPLAEPTFEAGVDFEDNIRSLYDSSWALTRGLEVIEGPVPELLPDEWRMF